MKNKVALIGVYPPPIGGISVHIQRLSGYLDQLGISHTIYDNTEGQKDKAVIRTGSIEKWSLLYFFKAKESVIHCHFLRWQVRFVLSLLKLRGKRVIFSVHSYRPGEESFSWLKRWMIRVTGRLTDVFICVSPKIAADLIELGIPPDKTVVIPGFIPPVEETEPYVPEKVQRFLDGAKGPLLVANGAIGNFEQGRDLYGADLCVELVHSIKKDFPDLRLLFCITHTVDSQYLKELDKKIKEYRIVENILLIEEEMEFYPILKRADLFLRPTFSDGDALSVREALWFGIAVVASDCVNRPDGVVTFTNRQFASLVEKTRNVLLIPQEQAGEIVNYADEIVRTYSTTHH